MKRKRKLITLSLLLSLGINGYAHANIESMASDTDVIDNASVQVTGDSLSEIAMSSNSQEIVLADQTSDNGILATANRNFSIYIDESLEPVNASQYLITNHYALRAVHEEAEYNDHIEYTVINPKDGSVLETTTEEQLNLYYSEEGIYQIKVKAFRADGDSDSGELFNNVQRTASMVTVGGVLNNPEVIVYDPDTILVGRDTNDTYGDYTYHWEISELTESERVIKRLSGENRQPTREEIDSLPVGTYLITNTVDETVPEGYEVVEITDTTSGAFRISEGSVVVEHIILGDDDEETLYEREEPQFGRINTDYTTRPLEISGYDLVSLPDNQNGKFTDSEQLVTYYYKETPVTETEPSETEPKETDSGTSETDSNGPGTTETEGRETLPLENGPKDTGSTESRESKGSVKVEAAAEDNLEEERLPETGSRQQLWLSGTGMATLCAAVYAYYRKRC